MNNKPSGQLTPAEPEPLRDGEDARPGKNPIAGHVASTAVFGSATATETVLIERMTYGSEAIGHLANGKAVFVAHGAPGDVCEVKITEDKARFARATITGLVEPSPVRAAQVPCKQFCGGCPWAHLAYDAQLEAKRASVIDALVRTAHMDVQRAEGLVGQVDASRRQWGYRNKLEMVASTDAHGRLNLGFFQEGTHDAIAVDTCPLACKPLERSPKALRGALRFVQGAQDLGIYRVGVRGSVRTKGVEIALWTPPGPFPRKAAAKTLVDALRATSVVRVLAQQGSERRVKKVEVLSGDGFWEESLDDSLFRTSAPSFFQVNTAQAEKLVKHVLAGLEVREGSFVADLYAGGGTFSVPLALAGADVVAIEQAPSSVRDLRRNANLNSVDVEVVCGDAAQELEALEGVDALVVDPPRAGLEASMASALAGLHPKRMAYVSCNPQTWARDVALLEREGMRLVGAQPVDMFPQTYHVEVASIFEPARV